VTEVPESNVQGLRRAFAPHGRLPSWADAGLALALLAVALVHTRGAGVLGVVLDVAMVLPLLWRRQAPVAVFSLIWAVAAVQGLTEAPTFTDTALLVAFYTVASTTDRRKTIATGMALELGVVFAATKSAPGAGEWLREFIALSGLATAAGVLGINVRNRRHTLAGLRERAERLQQEHEREVALATATERARIAREMHDVVAHNLSVMVALCDGAGYHIHDAPERVASALELASRTGRQALAEMRQLLGVLRETPAGADLAPQPGIRQIEDLVEQIRVAGIPVTYSLSGEIAGAPPGMELAIYRIVQEALTNTLKHAGPGARASVTVACAGDTVDVEVTDTGTSSPVPRAGGAGLRGMRERAAVYGGSLEAGPRPAGGWHVRASLGLPAAPEAATAAATR
jgi:signal transduction histidine kinase